MRSLASPPPHAPGNFPFALAKNYQLRARANIFNPPKNTTTANMPIQLNRDQFRWTNGRGHNQKPILYAQKTNTRGLGTICSPLDPSSSANGAQQARTNITSTTSGGRKPSTRNSKVST